MTSSLSRHIKLPEPRLAFHAERASDVHIHPLEGLIEFGPYSRQLVPSPIRIATIAPFGESKRLNGFLRELKEKQTPRERREYLPDWPGFESVFKVQVVPASEACRVELDKEFEAEFEKSNAPHVTLSDRLLRELQNLQARRSEYDVVFVYLPTRWSRGFWGTELDDFDLHDHLKAVTATRAIPLQIIREDRAVAYSCRASVMWRIGLALYAKAGGVPWKLAEADPETAYIGISYAVRAQTSAQGARFVTCCSQVFDADGSGLEFVAYDAREVEVLRDNPYLSRSEMFRVMTRSLDLYRRRHAGRSPLRMVVHKSTEFKQDEIEGCMEALHLCESVDLLQIVDDVPWRAVKMDQSASTAAGAKAVAARYPVERGTLLEIGPRDSLLWLHGAVRGIDSSNTYFQGKKGTPRPIRLVRHAGHGPWDDNARSALALSKMNWNNDSLYDPSPVTMSFARVLARVVKRMPILGSSPYQVRFFM